jgi:hypothetical protein
MYKFKSRVTGDLIMLEPNGRQILKILGKDDASMAKGILLPEHMLPAIAALEAAVAQDEAAQKQRAQDALDKGQPLPRAEGISLRLRAVPFIAMVKRCHQADEEIVWGV